VKSELRILVLHEQRFGGKKRLKSFFDINSRRWRVG
jgi:hypothetical protein